MAKAPIPTITWDTLFFQTTQQKVLRFLCSQRETSYSLRVLASKLKGVRGVGGIQGLEQILVEFEQVGMISFIDNRRGIRIEVEHPTFPMIRQLWAICEFESLFQALREVTQRGILLAAQPAEAELLIVGPSQTDVQSLIEQNPNQKNLKWSVLNASLWETLPKKDPKLYSKAQQGIQLWGTLW